MDLCLDAQTELVETLQKINDRDSADKYADEVDDLANQFFKLHDSISDTPEEKKNWRITLNTRKAVNNWKPWACSFSLRDTTARKNCATP